MKYRDMHLRRFGHAVVIGRIPSTSGVPATALCVCDCGRVFRRRSDLLRPDVASSCGCLRKPYTRVYRRHTNKRQPDPTPDEIAARTAKIKTRRLRGR